MRIGLAHQNTGPFVQEVARALKEAGMLAWYATTYADKPDAVWRKGLARMAEHMGLDLDSELRRRSVEAVPRAFLRTYPARELLRTVVARIDAGGRAADWLHDWAAHGFDHWVATGLGSDIDAVYGYEYVCDETFQAAKRLGLKCIYEVPSPEHEFVETLLEREYARHPSVRPGSRDYLNERRRERTQRRRREWYNADLVIANSEFCKHTYELAGLPADRIRVVPLASPAVNREGVDGGSRGTGRLRCLWAGSFSVLKGAHYLCEGWRSKELDAWAPLDVFGAVTLPSRAWAGLRSVSFNGAIPREQLFQRYRDSDVLVFPSLCDGFGLVVTEAFANGLPVITTKSAGASQFVEHGVNGLIVPAHDAEALADALVWCVDHRDEVARMRTAALETAEQWQWPDFRHSLVQTVREGLDGSLDKVRCVRESAL